MPCGPCHPSPGQVLQHLPPLQAANGVGMGAVCLGNQLLFGVRIHSVNLSLILFLGFEIYQSLVWNHCLMVVGFALELIGDF